MKVVKSKQWLNKTHRRGPMGGNGGKPCSEETKRKIGNSNKGKKHSEETKKILSDLNLGFNNRMFGKTHSQEVKDFISQNNKGRPITKERRQQISEQTTGTGNPNYGKHRPHTDLEKEKIRLASLKMWKSEEHRKNMSDKHIGKTCGSDNGMFGKTHSEETKEKMRKSHQRYWALKRGLNEL